MLRILNKYNMLSKRVEKTLNDQVRIEAESSQIYLAMASWAENKGLAGVSEFLYDQSDEERTHMLKIVKFINERGGHATITELKAPETKYSSLKQLFQSLYNHELFVSERINNLVGVTLEEKDYSTHNFI